LGARPRTPRWVPVQPGIKDRTIWRESIITYVDPMSVRNLSNIAHTRDCIALKPELTESQYRSFRSIACMSDVIGAFLRAERGHQRAGTAASFVMLPAASRRQAPSSCSLGAVHDGHER